MATATATRDRSLPMLPAGLMWSVDRHYNAFAGPVCSLKIVRYRSHRVLGINFKWWETLSYSVVPDEKWWIDSEIESMAKRIAA